MFRTRPAHLVTTMVHAALGATRSYYKNKYWRLRTRRGAKRAMVAIAHKLLLAAYEVLAHRQPFNDELVKQGFNLTRGWSATT